MASLQERGKKKAREAAARRAAEGRTQYTLLGGYQKPYGKKTAAKKAPAKKAPAKKAAAKKAAVKKAAAKKAPAKKVAVRGRGAAGSPMTGAGGGRTSPSMLTGAGTQSGTNKLDLLRRHAAKAAAKRAPKKAPAKAPAKAPVKKAAGKKMQSPSQYGKRATVMNMRKRPGGEAKRRKKLEDYRKKYAAHKAANPNLYAGGGSVSSKKARSPRPSRTRAYAKGGAVKKMQSPYQYKMGSLTGPKFNKTPGWSSKRKKMLEDYRDKYAAHKAANPELYGGEAAPAPAVAPKRESPLSFSGFIPASRQRAAMSEYKEAAPAVQRVARETQHRVNRGDTGVVSGLFSGPNSRSPVTDQNLGGKLESGNFTLDQLNRYLSGINRRRRR